MFENLCPVTIGWVEWENADNEDFSDCIIIAEFDFNKITLSTHDTNIDTIIELPDDRVISVFVDEGIFATVNIDNKIFNMSIWHALKVEEYYSARNEVVENYCNIKNDEIEGICTSLYEETLNMVFNLIELSDTNFLLIRDAVLILQRLLSYKKFETINFTANIFGNAVFLEALDLFISHMSEFAELLEEEYMVQSNDKNYVAWALVSKGSITYYSNQWELRFGKYLDIEECNIFNEYVEMIINCNEINDSSDEVIAYFTYHAMKKGYITADEFLPIYFDICKKTFEEIRQNISKKSFRNKLKIGLSSKKTSFTINDVDMMNGMEFENFICDLYNKMGYNSEVTKASGDQGLDVIAEKNGKRIGIQAKCYSNTVGNSAIQEAVAGKNYYKCDKVIVVTNNSYTNSAIDLAQVNDVILWDRNILKEKISELFY